MADTNKPQKEQSGWVEVHVTASPVVEADDDMTEDDLIRKIRQIVREEFATVGLAEKAGAPGLPGESIKSRDGEDGTDGTDAYVFAGPGLYKSGPILGVNLENPGVADGGLEFNIPDGSALRVLISETYGLKLTSNGVELKFNSNQFEIDETNGLQLKLKSGDVLEFDGSNGLATTLDKCV